MSTTGGLLILGVLTMALAQPAGASDRLSTEHQPRAQQAIAKAQSVRETMTQTQNLQGISRRQERLLGMADGQLQMANRHYEAGRYADAAKVADKASLLIAKAWAEPASGKKKAVR